MKMRISANNQIIMTNADLARAELQLNENGYAILRNLLSAEECEKLKSMYTCDESFRSHIIMSRHGLGKGEYKYFAYPLPHKLEQLRTNLYANFAPIANKWNMLMNIPIKYPHQHQDFLNRCHEAGQKRPTPLILKYEEGDYNCLHQDLYGEQVFPLQVAILLAQQGADYTGGEFVITEKRGPQQRTHVAHLKRGDGVIFAVKSRPVHTLRGISKTEMRHGVSVVRSGNRYTVGLIFHDAL